MGPCPTCGQLTELEADFCPACGGYAAPATVYSYAPGRLSRPDGELDLIDLPVAARPPTRDQRLAAPVEGRPAGPSPAASGTRSLAHDLAARLRASAGGRGEGRWLVAAATLIVLVIAAGTVLLELDRHGPPSTLKARSAPSTSTPAASQTVSPSPGPQVSVGPAVASSPQAAAALSFLASYFEAINDHNFAAYQQLFSEPLQADLSAASFSAGYGTTTDSAITLTGIGTAGSGELIAQVSFVSHQQPAASPTNSACTSWNVSLYLLQQGSGYLLLQPPAGYQASYTACR